MTVVDSPDGKRKDPSNETRREDPSDGKPREDASEEPEDAPKGKREGLTAGDGAELPDQEYVTLVDKLDRDVGRVEKLQAHRDGLLHRAVSVVLLDADGRMLLQRRHPEKYHSGGLWSNTACGHPRPGESASEAAVRRLREEMGIDCELRHAFEFVYESQVGHHLLEHEYDHVFLGECDDDPTPDPTEVDEWQWTHPRDIARELADHPEGFTPWFRILFGHLVAANVIRIL